MNGIKLLFGQITLSFVVTLALVGVYCNRLLPSGSTKIRAESATPEVLTAKRGHSALKLSMQSQALAELQTASKELKFYRGSGIGDFVPPTEEPTQIPSLIRRGFSAVQVAQQHYGLPADSVVDSAIWRTFSSSKVLVQRPKFSQSRRVNFVPPRLPPGRSAPGRRSHAGSRCGKEGKCLKVSTPLTALVPEYNIPGEEQSVFGLTVAEYPTFWFYVPYELKSDHPVEFRLQDEQNWQTDKYIYKTTFTAETAPGVDSFRLPSTVSPLEIGKRYFWSFVVQHDPHEPSANDVVTGWVERIAPSRSISQIKAAKPRERIALYAAKGIWYEALTTLAELRRVTPQDATLEAEWIGLLEAVGLNNIASQPIVQCCTPKQ